MSANLLPWQQRVVEEQAALSERLQKLDYFLNNRFHRESLTKPDLKLLQEQSSAMHRYHAILELRIARFKPQ